MVRCHFCAKKTSVAFPCKYCDNDYCTKCRLQETHKCAGIDTLKSAKHQLLQDTLEKQKTESSKLVKF